MNESMNLQGRYRAARAAKKRGDLENFEGCILINQRNEMRGVCVECG